MTWELIGTLYEDQHDQLVEKARRIVGPDAEDIVHEAFLRVARRLETGEVMNAPGMLSMTVYTLSLNLLRDHDKEDIMDPDTIEALVDTPFILTGERAMFVTDFNEALLEIPRPEAIAFTLTELRGLSQDEAGEIIGVDQATVSRRSERARRALAARLQ